MAVVDLKTGKIIGAKKDSLTWWHEKAHIIYNESPKGVKNSLTQTSFFFIIAIGLTVHVWFPNSIYWKLVTSLACFFILYYLGYEEIWCWIYARKKKK